MNQVPIKISVCIPAYNRSAVLPALLESILTQDFDGFEVVINEVYEKDATDLTGVLTKVKATPAGASFLKEVVR